MSLNEILEKAKKLLEEVEKNSTLTQADFMKIRAILQIHHGVLLSLVDVSEFLLSKNKGRRETN